jgi:hypothetical protein
MSVALSQDSERLLPVDIQVNGNMSEQDVNIPISVNVRKITAENGTQSRGNSGDSSRASGVVDCERSFSSTPWPLQSGHELRPVVSHCKIN